MYTHVNIQHNNPSISVIIQKKKTHTELIQYLHAANFSPVKSTFERAIKRETTKLGQDWIVIY